MSVNLTCCGELNISKLFCNCFPNRRAKEEPPGVTKPGLTSADLNPAVLATPKLETLHFGDEDNLFEWDILVVAKDVPREKSRILSIQGQRFLELLQTPPERVVSARSPRKNTTTTSTTPPSSPLPPPPPPPLSSPAVDFKTNDDLVGLYLEDVLPVESKKFFLGVLQQTFAKQWTQLSIFWLSRVLLIRSYPLLNHRQSVIGAVMLISPYHNEVKFDSFVLSPNDRLAASDPQLVAAYTEPMK